MAFEVLEHIEDDLSWIKEWWNILNEHGKLLISVPAHRASGEAVTSLRATTGGMKEQV